MTNDTKLNILRRVVADWLDTAYEKTAHTTSELHAIELFWDDAAVLISDSIDDDYFEED